MAYTDHDVFIAHDELNDENFLALHGYEMEFLNGDYNNDKKRVTYALFSAIPTICSRFAGTEANIYPGTA